MSEDEENLSLFRQEAEELLGEITETLLVMESPDSTVAHEEQINRVFRAVHTIKGLASMCELDELSAFAHRVEDVLAKARAQTVAWTPSMTSAMFAVVDHLKLLIERDPKSTGDKQSEPILVALEHPPELPKKGKRRNGGTQTSSHEKATANNHRRLIYLRGDVAKCREAGAEDQTVARVLEKLGECTDASEEDVLHLLLVTTNTEAELAKALFFLPETCFTTLDLGLLEEADLSRIPDLADMLREGLAGDLREAWTRARSAKPRTSTTVQAQPIRSLRISSDRLDRLVEIVGEIVVTQGRITQLAANSSETKWSQPVEDMSRLVDSLREVAMNIRMMPVANIFRILSRMVRDVAAELGKEVSFVTSGGETEMDKAVLDKLMDPLLHLVRNSLDHGIGTPAERLAAGKPRRGTIRLSASHEGGQVLIALQDDGDGVSLDRVRERGIEMGLLTPDHTPSRRELHALLFAPGFSTRSEVTNLSGRGVGLDVVRRQVDLLRGSVELKSEARVGTAITLRLPLTLAIIDGLLVEVADARYVLPLSSVRECLDFPAFDQERRLTRMIPVRDEPIPFLDARCLLEQQSWGKSPAGIAILIEHDTIRFVLVVDRVLGDLQTVVKSVGSLFRRVSLVSGATVLGDGSLALILDPAALARELNHFNPITPEPAPAILPG